jgi:uncharacterized membrane protein YdfJ with MMPL/SSD domain
VIAAWAAAFLVSIVAVVSLLDLTSEGEVTNEPESERAYELIGDRMPFEPDDEFVSELVLVRSDRLRTDDPAVERKVTALVADLRRSPAVHNATSYVHEDDPALVSPDSRAAVIPLGLRGDCEEAAGRVVEIVEAANHPPFEVTVTGECTAERDINAILDEDLRKGELMIGLPAALLVLLLVFGTVVAALVPLVLAVVAITIALALAAVVSQAVELSVFLVNMLTVMGLAIGIDYSLFVVSRFREERATGRSREDAIAVTGATASRAVLFSGLAFALAMSGLLLVPDTILRSLGFGAIAVGVTSVAAALTVPPAVLALLGDRVGALRIPIPGLGATGEGRVWSAIARGVTRRPVVWLALSAGVLLAATAPVLDLKLGTSGLRTLPNDAVSKQGFLALERSFGVGTVDSAIVVVDGDVEDERVSGGIRRLRERLRASPLFVDPSVETNPAGDLAVVEALVVGDSRDERALEAVEQLRERDVPAAFAGADAEVLVTGETAEELDYTALMQDWVPRIFAFVLALSFVLLTIAFRSIVVSAKAIALNLLSVGAAYGVVVLVFQKGVGNELLGLHQTELITTWLPIFLFSVLFGLSMDYHVFLLSRIRERWAETGDTRDALVHGIGSTARVITGAALIIIVVFAGFAAGDLVETQQIGFGVGVALLIDATLVRSVLVPASMQLLGRWNWFLPRWLGWLPDVQVEKGAAR